MVRVFYCVQCKRVYYLSNHLKRPCQQCDGHLLNLKILYSDYTLLSSEERVEHINKMIDKAAQREAVLKRSAIRAAAVKMVADARNRRIAD